MNNYIITGDRDGDIMDEYFGGPPVCCSPTGGSNLMLNYFSHNPGYSELSQELNQMPCDGDGYSETVEQGYDQMITAQCQLIAASIVSHPATEYLPDSHSVGCETIDNHTC